MRKTLAACLLAALPACTEGTDAKGLNTLDEGAPDLADEGPDAGAPDAREPECAARDLLEDGGFDQNPTTWTLGGDASVGSGGVTGLPPQSPGQILWVGPGGASGARRKFTVPEGAVAPIWVTGHVMTCTFNCDPGGGYPTAHAFVSLFRPDEAGHWQTTVSADPAAYGWEPFSVHTGTDYDAAPGEWTLRLDGDIGNMFLDSVRVFAVVCE